MLLDFSNEILELLKKMEKEVTLTLENIPYKRNQLCLCIEVPNRKETVPILMMEPYYKRHQGNRHHI